jgi:hypothetical protein
MGEENMVNFCLLADLKRHRDRPCVNEQAVFQQEARQAKAWRFPS